MEVFIARVVLHNPVDPKSYLELHKAMQKGGFARTVAVSGQKYHLPEAEYLLRSSLQTIDEVLVAVKEIVASVGYPVNGSGKIGEARSSSVLVTKVTAIKAAGLIKV